MTHSKKTLDMALAKFSMYFVNFAMKWECHLYLIKVPFWYDEKYTVLTNIEYRQKVTIFETTFHIYILLLHVKIILTQFAMVNDDIELLANDLLQSRWYRPFLSFFNSLSFKVSFVVLCAHQL